MRQVVGQIHSNIFYRLLHIIAKYAIRSINIVKMITIFSSIIANKKITKYLLWLC